MPTLSVLLKALREASTAASVSSAMEDAFDRLVSTHSLAESQHLVFSLQQYRLNESFYEKLQQAAAICTEPLSKTEYLGFVLLQESVYLVETSQSCVQREMLLKVFHVNNGVLPGYLAAITAGDGPFFHADMDNKTARRTFGIISPVLKSVLMDNLQPEGHKCAVLDAMTRIAWHVYGHLEDSHNMMRTTVAHILVQALELVPYAQLSQRTYIVHVALAVDLLSAEGVHDQVCVDLATRTACCVLESTQLLVEQNVGVVALLQSLEQLAQALPEAFWCSVFLTSAAYFLVYKCDTPLEQQLVLRMIQHILAFARNVVADDVSRRTVYVEILLLPFCAMLSVHGSIVSDLLTMVVEIMSISKYDREEETESIAPLTETLTHARSAVQMIGDERRCQHWLGSLFLSKSAISSNEMDKWLALLVVALLSDGRSALRSAAAECLERQVNNSSKYWDTDTTKALVASLVCLVSQKPSGNNSKTASVHLFGKWMISCLYSLAALAALAATTTETMRVILRLIDSMNGVAKMQPMALQLMYEVWRNEPRVFPRLETMLLQPTSSDEDIERHVVRMAIIKMVCEKDPELGVQFISSIQGFLKDKLETVVSMAMDAITALCKGDCLDFYVAFTIIAQKMRKKKLTCVDGPLFQERLCCFYALGGNDSAANKKHAAKLLNQAWEFADSTHATVRKSAYEALCNFPLDMLGLCMPVDDIAEQMSDGDNAVLVEEQLDDLLQRLQNEHDSDVRVEIEKLMAKVIEHESTKLTAGVGRGQRMVSQASGVQRQQQNACHQSRSAAIISAVATKEMKLLLPLRSEVESLFTTNTSTTDWAGFLLAYQPNALIDRKNVTRKDKLVRLATQNVDELVKTVTTALQSMKLPWASVNVSAHDDDGDIRVFLLIQSLMEGWRGFMKTYISSLDELAELKTPIGVDDADVAFRVFSDGISSLFDLLLNHTSNRIGGALAAGALAGKLCESRHWSNSVLRLKYEDVVNELLLQLALSIEQARVFSTYTSDVRVTSVGASIALQLSFGRRKCENSSNFYIQLKKIEKMFLELYHNKSDDLLASCALIGLSHIAVLYTNGDELETHEMIQWRHQRVKFIAERVLESFLHTNHAKQNPNESSLSHGDVVFPLAEVTEANSFVDTISSEFEKALSSGDIVVRWSSLIGLAQLSSGFSIIKRLDWLMNVQRILTAVWKHCESANITAVALGPVLLQCVRFNLAPTSHLEAFVTTCNHRAAESSANSLDSGFLMMAAANVLCRLHSYGGFPSTIQNQTNLAVRQVEKTLENESNSGQAVNDLMLLGIANFFHLSIGIAGSSVNASLYKSTHVELTLESGTIATLIKLARDFTTIKTHRGVASAVLGAIARATDRFYISQKKKMIDAEVRALPSDRLLVKTLEWLRRTNPSDDNFSYSTSMTRSTPETRTAISLLGCLTSTGAVLPLLDYASLTHRIMLRLCSIDVSIACIRFAATQDSCDELLAGKLLSSSWFGNASAVLQAEMISWLSQAATRIPTDVLETLLRTIYNILKDVWCRETSSNRSVLLFDSWTAMLCNLVSAKTARHLATNSVDMIHKVVFETMVREFPFNVHAFGFVKQFAVHVLSKLDYNGRNPVDVLLQPNVVNSSVWSWWRSGVFVIELAKLGVLNVTKREASLIFQWLLRHDFHEWTDENLGDMYLQPLIAQMGALVSEHTKLDEMVSVFLDVIDALSQAMASLDPFVDSHVIKCRALFTIVSCVLAWNTMLSHEKYLLMISRVDTIANIKLASDVLPFGLRTACAHGTQKVSVIGERLLALLYQLIDSKEVEALRYTNSLHICSPQIYRTAENGHHLSSTIFGPVREFWCLCDTNLIGHYVLGKHQSDNRDYFLMQRRL